MNEKTGATTPASVASSVGARLAVLLQWLVDLAWALAAFVWRNLQKRRLKAFLRIGMSAHHRYLRDDGNAMAGYIAFAGFLAVFPFTIFATALGAMFISDAQSDAIIAALFQLAPEHIAQTLEPVIFSVRAGSGSRLVTLSGLGAIWVASTGIEAIRVGFDRAYGNPMPRPFMVRRVIALVYVLLATVTFGMLGVLLIAAPVALVIAEATVGFEAPFGVSALRYGLAITMLTAFLYQLHLGLPTRRPPRRRLLPGIGASMVLWALGAYLFSRYLHAAPSYSITYGALAGVIVTLLFFYLTAASILMGAQVNAVLMTFRRPTTADSTA